MKISGEVFLLFLLLACPVLAQSDAPVARIDAGAYQRVVDENLELRKEQARLEVEAGELRRKNAALLVDVQDLERKRDQLTVLVSQLKTPEETRSEMARLQSEKLVLVREIERLRQALMATESASAPAVPGVPPPVAAPAPASGSDLFRKIEQENADLRQELARVKELAMNESVGRTVASTNEAILKKVVGELASQVKQAKSDLESLRKREASLKKAVEVQARKAFEAEKRASGQVAAGSRQEAEIQDLKSQISNLKSEISNQNSEIKTLKSQIAKQKSASVQPNNPTTQQLNNSLPALLAAAERQLAAKRPGVAEELYLKALKLEPRNAAVCYNLGVLYGEYLGDPKQAARYYRRYLELAPKAPDAGKVRSWILELDARSKW